ncbi:TniQ family protein [Nocardia zapadnayensis]|nr:TniQ family protein [Nocardia zapadnayensis]MCX0270052.1 TniQ family protein [Nocardia zapadnayensis]
MPGESLLSWVDHTASIFGLGRMAMAERLGVVSTRRTPRALADAMSAPDNETVDVVSARTGLSADEVRSMTAHSILTLPYAESALRNAESIARPVFGVGGFDAVSSAVCPECVRDSGGRWRFEWKVGWTVACAEHRRYLIEGCDCGRPLHSVDRGVASRNQCVGQALLAERSCSQLVVDLESPPVRDADIFADQDRTSDLLAPPQWKSERAAARATRRWLRLMWVIQVIAQHGLPGALDHGRVDPVVVAAFDRYCTRRGEASFPQKTPPVPGPDKRLVVAALLRIAWEIILGEDPRERIEWFLEPQRSRWDLIDQGMLFPRVGVGPLAPALREGLDMEQEW